jgi:hypothetical protein
VDELAALTPKQLANLFFELAEPKNLNDLESALDSLDDFTQ